MEENVVYLGIDRNRFHWCLDPTKMSVIIYAYDPKFTNNTRHCLTFSGFNNLVGYVRRGLGNKAVSKATKLLSKSYEGL